MSVTLPPLFSFQDCPWLSWENPKVFFCEESLCGWVRTPANAWSNLAFFIVGLAIIFLERKSVDKDLRDYGAMTLLIGILSFFYHASFSRIGQIGDLSAMFLLSLFLCRDNMHRMGWLTHPQGRIFFWSANLVCTALLFWNTEIGAPLFFIQCMFALWLELKLRKRGKGPSSYTFFKLGFFTWLVAQLIWFLDITKVMCEPTLHWFQGHAAWHLLMALLAWLIYRHYRMIREQRLS